jgi:hypothetical protein
MNASGRLNTCKSWGSRGVAIHLLATGKRVRNTYATFPLLWHSPGKLGLIPHIILMRHLIDIKASAVTDGRAVD